MTQISAPDSMTLRAETIAARRDGRLSERDFVQAQKVMGTLRMARRKLENLGFSFEDGPTEGAARRKEVRDNVLRAAMRWSGHFGSYPAAEEEDRARALFDACQALDTSGVFRHEKPDTP